jgi:hypothetical protein
VTRVVAALRDAMRELGLEEEGAGPVRAGAPGGCRDSGPRAPAPSRDGGATR